MSYLTEKQKSRVIAQAEKEVRNFLGSKNVQQSIEKSCLFWAFFTAKILRQRYNLPSCLQAGSAYWPITTLKKDDGVSPNRYGYEFSFDEKCKLQLMQAYLPEMHVWTAIIDDDSELIDATVPFFKQRAIECGFEVNCDYPPYFWHKIKNSLPWGVSYVPDIMATKIAYAFIDNAINGNPLIIQMRE